VKAIQKYFIFSFIGFLFGVALCFLLFMVIVDPIFEGRVKFRHEGMRIDITNFSCLNDNPSLDISMRKPYVPIEFLTEQIDYNNYIQHYNPEKANDVEKYIFEYGKKEYYEIWRYRFPTIYWIELTGQEGIALVNNHKDGNHIREVITGYAYSWQ
jgi:hypothetical protein